MPATLEQVVAVVGLLHSRGREATPQQVEDWLQKMVSRYLEYTGREIDAGDICTAVLRGQGTFTMCLHLHFGDALSGDN